LTKLQTVNWWELFETQCTSSFPDGVVFSRVCAVAQYAVLEWGERKFHIMEQIV